MKYCSECGANVTQKKPENDEHLRFVCDDCEIIHYHNPKVIAGALPIWQDKVLLCRRAINPRHGLWTLPAGFMENGETLAQAAARETYEEATAVMENIKLYTVISLPQVNQVYMIYRGNLANLDFSPGIESLETELFDEKDIPWDELAFKTVTETLRHYFHDRKNNQFPIHDFCILKK
ncbi:MAG: NUDIX hydrolase [Methylococcales bacterium]|jgi:ADP-ribose pyrophosphatase YjhB (NUDIX family)|nr:NUDIX hydrolase [Methylococcales bacterium]